MRGKVPEGLTLGYPETQPQRQPGLSDLRRTGQQVQSLGQQIIYEERVGMISEARKSLI